LSFVSAGIGLAKKIKHKFEDEIKAASPVYISPVRRIEGVKTKERICAMTFDDGPTRILPSSGASSRALTLELIETLERFDAKGTFDCIGDTSENYPDVCGKEGSAMWGGKAYDHYPDYMKDSLAGAKNCPELIERILLGGHEITSHSYKHRIFGAKPLVYANRKYIGNIDEVVDDLEQMHGLLLDFGCNIKMSRPPHYVDRIDSKFTAYDAFALMGYQYLAAGPDGGGWLPLGTYEQEVEVMRKNIEDALLLNPDAFCGKIIFQKDGCNMARRTPVYDGLYLQLEALTKYGYKVVSVSELMKESPFSDLGRDDEGFDEALRLLDMGCCPAYSDNCVKLSKQLSREEIAMTIFGWEAVRNRVFDKARLGFAYKYAMKIAQENQFEIKDEWLKLPKKEVFKQIIKTYENR